MDPSGIGYTRHDTEVLREYNRARPPSHYIVDSTYVKNAYGRTGLGRNPVDRGRKALKVSAISKIVRNKFSPIIYLRAAKNIFETHPKDMSGVYAIWEHIENRRSSV